jgi:hypothetical protein
VLDDQLAMTNGADNELFDACCDLAAATHRLKCAAADPEAVPGLAATLGCLDKSLQQLAEGLEDLENLAALTSGAVSLVEAQADLLRCAARLDAARARVGRAMDSPLRRN